MNSESGNITKNISVDNIDIPDDCFVGGPENLTWNNEDFGSYVSNTSPITLNTTLSSLHNVSIQNSYTTLNTTNGFGSIYFPAGEAGCEVEMEYMNVQKLIIVYYELKKIMNMPAVNDAVKEMLITSLIHTQNPEAFDILKKLLNDK